MEDSIKNLQCSLAKDLVELETSDISEHHLQMIEDTYEQVYRILNQAHRE
jgi:hypothetical protein